MKKYHWFRIYGLFLMICLFALSILVSAGKAMEFYRQYVNQTSIIKGIQTINSASETITDYLSEVARECAYEQYEALLQVADDSDSVSLSVSEMEGYYRIGYYNRLRGALGDSPEQLNSQLNDKIAASNIAGVRTRADSRPELYCEKDEQGNITSIRLRGLIIEYTDPIIGQRSDSISYEMGIPKVTFYTGNDEMFDYCIIAGKGLYMTGATSSIIGNIFAGGHPADEVREAEIKFGEIGTYGGINILSTQVGINANTIVSGGDININGSFVIIAPENDKGLNCYARSINSVEGFANKSVYSLEGNYYKTDTVGDEWASIYFDNLAVVDDALSELDGIEIYYDTANDEGYSGPYRMIMSTGDVEITEDFRGIVITPFNVIIHNGVVFEGMIICKDRVYSQGNNIIVANKDVVRKLIAYETTTEYGMKASDFIGGIKNRGFEDPEYYVLPYR